MNLRYKRKRDYFGIKNNILLYLEKNIKEIFIVGIFFIIGIIIGILFINKMDEMQKEQIISYIQSFISNLKDNNSINETMLLFNSIKYNFYTSLFLWFIGLSIIGIPIVYLTICFRGFCLGYAISSVILSIGLRKRNYICIINFILTKFNYYSMYFITWS